MAATTLNDRQVDAASALSILGRSANSSGPNASIAATGGSDAVLRESSSSIGWGTIATGGIANSAVTYAKIQNVGATARILGRKTAGSGVIEELTASDLSTTFGVVLLSPGAAQSGTISITGAITSTGHTGVAGTALALAATAPSVTSATQVGVAVNINASNAVAGSVTSGAQAGGAVNITAGDAARKTSGNAAGGGIVITAGAGIGAGLQGSVTIDAADVNIITGTLTSSGTGFVVSAGTFNYSAGNTFSVTSAATTFSKSSSGANVNVTIQNLSNTSSSAASLYIKNGGLSGDDVWIYFGGQTSGAGVDFSIGIDATDGLFKLSNSSILGANDTLTIAAGGALTYTRKVSGTLAAQQSAMQLGITGGTENAGSGPSLLFFADNSAASKQFLGRVSGVWETPTSGSEAGGILFSVRANTGDTTASTACLRMLSTQEVRGGEVNGGSWGIQVFTETVTWSGTTGVSTTGNLLPANSLILAVMVRNTSALTNVTAYEIGDSTSVARFGSSGAVNGSSGTTFVAPNVWDGSKATTLALSPWQSAADKVKLTRTTGSGTQSGSTEIVVYAIVFTPPTS